ncbi:MAG: hypothetical protein AW11_02513 [Candidatus Accumulibacter regalis]|mgnify:CR=1 FL=1|jgi:hypothetical protein|uniref:CDP-glycerol:poly(Glycerophosphate) glycerophosphotransferase n=1 Tax=Accumulibacter regalis TaxID=522306 RepID=A0A011QE51_ACCRE|nr:MULTISPECIES: CDP-glycerol glycerophosphotransferase family protein [unclassified Candidatus Accumulibacter]EXI87385.1 MAG: hypothetical protein AW11_02513 [Candidatus Accumulibacter regalis]MBL8368309.1 CDP-glycerol glycerophosphotransferase family protein [Accumulibacter sp.]HRE72428.1 CDP-glycerol glycerophosphotransferase family protein [Accumulibacter sp.]
MFDWFRQYGKSILFLSSAPIDEVWTRSTALACRRSGKRVQVIMCGNATEGGDHAVSLYRAAGIAASQGVSFVDAAAERCAIAVTASSGLDRGIFPTRGRLFVHMPHSIASLHMIYPPGSFDGYDVLLAAGPQHDREFLALAKARGLTGRRVLAAGYGKLDVLVEMAKQGKPAQNARPKVLIAPSWGPDNLLDRCGPALAEQLAAQDFDVVVRPHPLFFLEHAPVLDGLRTLAGRTPWVTLESPLDGDKAIFDADVLVGDYSGTSFEFAALRRRPVVSVDVGLKIANPDWARVGLDPVELALRAELGPVVAPDAATVVAAVRDMLASPRAINGDTLARFLHGRVGDCGVRAAGLLDRLLRES